MTKIYHVQHANGHTVVKLGLSIWTLVIKINTTVISESSYNPLLEHLHFVTLSGLVSIIYNIVIKH